MKRLSVVLLILFVLVIIAGLIFILTLDDKTTGQIVLAIGLIGAAISLVLLIRVFVKQP